MQTGFILSASLATAMVAAPVSRAQADIIDFVAGAIVGQVIDHARRSNAEPQRVQRSSRTVEQPSANATRRSPPVSAKNDRPNDRPGVPATAEGREIQTALNYFGFEAGPVDGQLGEKSRAAISAYQDYLGYPQTGELSDFEKELLTTSHERARAGGGDDSEQVASAEDGSRELIGAVRSEMADSVVMASSPAAGGTAPAVGAAMPPVLMGTLAAPEAPSAQAPSDGSGPAGRGMSRELVSLFGDTLRPTASLAAQCSDVSLLTGTNGFTTLATLGDSRPALSEQLCLARSYAIRTGEDLARGLTASPQEVASHCQVYGRELRPHVAALSRTDRDAVLADLSGFLDGMDIPRAELAATATVCLSVGYRTDDMDVALGSALILTGLGEPAYAELMGHHLALGFGVAPQPDLAASWYDLGLDAAEAGEPVFAPGQPERTALIRKASAELTGRSADSLAVPQDAALPFFSIGE